MKKTITQHSSKRNFFRFMFIMAFINMSFSSFAATVYLKNAHDGTWETISNWVTTSGGSIAYGQLPQSGDYVIIPATVTNPSLSVNSAVTIEKLQVKTLTLTINSGASLSVTQNETSSPTVAIATGSIVNNGTFSVTSGASTAAHYLIQLDPDGSTVTNSSFTNNGTLNVNNTALVGAVNTTINATAFSFNQTTAGTTPTFTFNASGTVNLSLKPFTASSGSVAGFQPRLFNIVGGANAKLDGNFSFGSSGSPLQFTRDIDNGSSTSVLTIPSGANFTFYNESNSSSGQISLYIGKIINQGTLTFNAPTATGQFQGFFGLGALDNSGTINFTGKWLNKAIYFGNNGGQTYTLNNSGTINVNSTGAVSSISAYVGATGGTYAAPGGTNSIFQLTNSGTMNLYAASNALAINIGNNHADSWFKNTATGVLNVNGPIASGFAQSVNDNGSPTKLYKESPASTSMKFYNAGIVTFDESSNTANATKLLKNADGGTTDTKGNYAIINFVNALDGTGGTVKGRGVFLEGSFIFANSALGTLSPGYGTTSFNYGGSSATSTQVGTANIGQFDFQGANVALTGNVNMDINGATAATTGYDQIINSTASGLLNVLGVGLTVANGGGYTPAVGTSFDLFKATGSGGTRTNNFTSTSFPSANWSADYATATTAKTSYNIASQSIAGTSLDATGITDNDLANTNLTVSSGEFVANATKTIRSITLAPGAKLTLSSGTLTATNGVTLESDATGTATILGSAGLSGTVTAKQYLGSARNWYVSSPVSSAAAPSTNMDFYYEYVEAGNNNPSGQPGSSTVYWKGLNTGTTMEVGKGYIAKTNAGATVQFSGTPNNGDIETGFNLTRDDAKGKGFNLVGNPYPSYIDWVDVAAANPNLDNTYYYRTKNTNSTNTYTFVTWNGAGSSYVVSNGSLPVNTAITRYIPPTQAFWVRVKTGTSATKMYFNNVMREHRDDNNNLMKAPKQDTRTSLRLQLHNGTDSDELLIYQDAGASNDFDSYDSPKMMNNSTTIPDFYCKIGSERLVINGLNEITNNMELPLGFSLNAAATLNFRVGEMSNFAEGTKVYLLDKTDSKQTELQPETEYSFSTSTATLNNENRFSLLFRVPGVNTGNVNTEKGRNTIFVNANNQITIIGAEKATYSIYNAVGQMVSNGRTTTVRTIVNTIRQAGVYVVKLTENGTELSTRVVIK